jgi:hypothetical protein
METVGADGKKYVGIYRIDGDALNLAVTRSGAAPKDFTDKDANFALFKREKK